MTDNFYKAFEDKHRGGRELIKDRLEVYSPFIIAVNDVYPNASAVDLGCGRGEWLELLGEQSSFAAFGVDLDAGMLEICQQNKLSYKQQDALSALKGLEDESQAIVTGFHIVEHITFEDLQELVQQAYRVLKPEGILILETPNPENITVGTSEFYLDPTHQQPLPPKLLNFVVDYYGFYQTKVVRLQENKWLIDKQDTTLFEVLSGVSADYAVIAQKEKARNEIDSFSQEFGLTLNTLSTQFEQAQQRQFEQLEQNIRTVKSDLHAQALIQAESHAYLQAQIHLLDEHIQSLDGRIKSQEAQINAVDVHMQAVTNSKSWRYTQPIRSGLSMLKNLVRKRKQW